MEQRTTIIPVKMNDGTIMRVQATVLPGGGDVASNLLPFEGVSEAIESISKTIIASFEKVKPRKASVEFGLEVAAESGKLTALLVKGSGTASLKIVLEWGE